MLAGRPPLSQSPKPAFGHPIVLWFLSSPAMGISHCFTNIQDTTYTTERVEEKNKQARTWVKSKCKKGKVWSLSQHSMLLSVASVYSKIPTQLPRTRTHPLALADPASGSTGPNSSFSSRLSLTVAFLRLLLPALGPCLSSSSSGLVGNFVRKPFVWISRQSR